MANYGGSDYDPPDRPERSRMRSVVNISNSICTTSLSPPRNEYVDFDRPRRRSRSRSRSGSGSWSRTRSRSRSTSSRRGFRGRSRSRSFSPDQRRHRRSRSRDRGHRSTREWDRDRDRDWDRKRERERSWDRDDERYDSSNMETPSPTLMLRELPPDVDEQTLEDAVAKWDVPVENVRLIRDRHNGASRGFAYVDLVSTDAAQDWMSVNRGKVNIGPYLVEMLYSTSKRRKADDSSSGYRHDGDDWRCSKCSLRNFARRMACHRCGRRRKSDGRRHAASSSHSSRVETDLSTDDPKVFIGDSPCDTLLLRDLDALTTEERICEVLAELEQQVQQCRVMRDELTHASLCYALVQYSNVTEASSALHQCKSTVPTLRRERDDAIPIGHLEIGGKLVTVNFAKFTFSTVLALIEQEKQQAMMTYYGVDTDSSSTKTTREDRPEHEADPSLSSAAWQPSNAAAASATATAVGDDPYHQTPDVSQFQYEATSGFYYDANTKFYYDANSGYFYDASTMTYMYWDASTNSYIAAPTADASAGDASAESKKEKKKFKRKEAEAATATTDEKAAAAKIAKDMEKWAKQVNAHKDTPKNYGRISEEPVEAAQNVELSSSSASAAELDAAVNQAEKELLDWQKHVCALCKRQFADSETMVKHVRVSELHKTNMQALRRSLAAEKLHPLADTTSTVVHPTASAPVQAESAVVFSSGAVRYRDRAKERREKVGSDVLRRDYDLPSSSAAENGETSQSGVNFARAKPAVSGTAVKMMEKMGWQAGQGLGRVGQGRVEPIQVVQREKGAGLGTGLTIPVSDDGPMTTYKEKARRMAAMRYQKEVQQDHFPS